MKIYFIILLFSIKLLASPNWLYNIQKIHQNEIIGYGIDSNQHQAKQIAMADIANYMSVNIKSNTSIYKKTNNDKYTKDISTNLETSSQANLTGIIFTNIEHIDGLWYVSAKYDNSPLELKFKKLLPKDLINQKQNIYLSNTLLFKILNHEMVKILNYTIIRKDNLWQIKYNNIILPLSENNFFKLFTNYKSQEITIKANKEIYQQNDKMYFNIKHKKNGYISILYVEHNGKVGILKANKKSNKSFIYPDIKSEDSFTIVNPYNKPISELYIAIYSEQPLDLYEFESVTDNLLDDSNYNFDKLLNRLDKYIFSTYTIKIK